MFSQTKMALVSCESQRVTQTRISGTLMLTERPGRPKPKVIVSIEDGSSLGRAMLPAAFPAGNAHRRGGVTERGSCGQRGTFCHLPSANAGRGNGLGKIWRYLDMYSD